MTNYINTSFNDHWSFVYEDKNTVVIDFCNDRVNVNGLLLPCRSSYYSKLNLLCRAIYMIVDVLKEYEYCINEETTELLIRTFGELINLTRKEAVEGYKIKLGDKLTDLLQDLGYNCEVY